MKDKTNQWIPWISALLLGIIAIGILVLISESFNIPRSYAAYIPNPIPSAQLVGLSTIEAINEFSGSEKQLEFYIPTLIGISFSLILIFVIIPFLYMKGSLQSENRTNPSPLWYTGSALMLMVSILPVITVIIGFYRFQHTLDASKYSRTKDIMRMELMDISFVAAEQILKLEDVSNISEINTKILSEVEDSNYQFSFISNPEDTSMVITISSEEMGNFQVSTTVNPYDEQIFVMSKSF